jgi:TRAP-type mannitol/chloroaromatic compound transport system permease small subunit
MAMVSGALVRVIRGIDTVSDWSGRIAGWLVIPLILVMAWEIAVRYVAKPTFWAFDLSYMLYGALFMMGAAYTLHRGSHIRTDFLYQMWPVKVQASVDAFCYLFLFFPGIAVFFWLSIDFAVVSWRREERSMSSAWMPYLYPLKTVLPVALGLLLLQGIAEFLKCVHAFRTGEWLTKQRTIEEALADDLPAKGTVK